MAPTKLLKNYAHTTLSATSTPTSTSAAAPAQALTVAPFPSSSASASASRRLYALAWDDKKMNTAISTFCNTSAGLEHSRLRFKLCRDGTSVSFEKHTPINWRQPMRKSSMRTTIAVRAFSLLSVSSTGSPGVLVVPHHLLYPRHDHGGAYFMYLLEFDL